MKKRQEFRRLLHVMRPGFFSTFGSNGRLRWWDPHAIVSLSARGSQREPRNAFLFVWLGFWVSRSEGKKKGSKGRRRAPLKRRQTPKLGKQKKERDREREREKNNSANDRRLSALKTRTLSSISEEKSWKKNKKEGEETDGMEVWNLSIRSSFDFVLSIPYPTIISS